MQCPNCKIENRRGAKFCVGCGASLALDCAACGATLPTSAKFCDACGARVRATPVGVAKKAVTPDTAAQRAQSLVPMEFAEGLLATHGQVQAERRLVTILFSDVTGSTSMAEELDPEHVMEIMDGAFDVLIEPIHRYEGTLARLMGDAILAFFGAPIAHEDDPERAIRAALDIIQGARRYAATLEHDRGIQGFNVRVGINTGLVVTGEVGSDLRAEYTAMGDAINLAARVEHSAPAGGVLISHQTYRHVRGVFDVQPQELLVVKGKGEPVQTYLVERAKPRAWRVETRGVEGIETHMVGRDVELLALRRVFEDVLEDAETRVITVVGDAGVGKTRLLEEFLDWLELRPETVWYFKGGAASTTQTVPYQIWHDLFAYRFQILESDSGTEAMEKFRAGMAGVLRPERADLVGQLVGFDLGAAGSEAVQALMGSPSFRRLGRAYLVQYFRGLLEQNPMVMLLEDLQWADDRSLDLVAHLVARIPDAALLIVGAARPGLFDRRPNWGEGQEAYKQLDLEPLSKRASRALVQEILQKAVEVPEQLRELIVECAAGNPYYVEELIKMLIEDGVIVRSEPHWQVQVERLVEVQVPSTLTAVLQARLDALPQAERAVLQRASVVGRDFWDRLVDKLATDEAGSGDVDFLLRALRERELVFRREQSSFADAREYTFKHTILRDVTYETVLLRRRRRYHGQVAAWLEANAGERLGEYLGMIARHYELAGERVRAARYWRRSGEEAYEVGSLADALEAFERALGLLPHGGGTERAALAVRLGQSRLARGEFEQAARHLEVGLDLARGAAEPAAEVAALNGLGEVAWRKGHYEEAERRLQHGLIVARTRGDTAGQALAAQHLARTLWLRGEYDEAACWAQASLEWYEGIGDRQGVIAARKELAIHKTSDEARGILTRNLSLARELGDRLRVAQVLVNLGELAREEGAHQEARACYEESLAIFEEIGDRRNAALVLANLGALSIDQGRDAAAWEYRRRAMQDFIAMQDIPHALCGLIPVSRLWVRAGQPERAAELLGLALRHPASYIEVEEAARPVLAALSEAMSAGELEAALARGAGLELEQAVEEILCEP